MGVNDRRHRIGGIVEAVDEFEAERDQQRQTKQQHRAGSKPADAGTREVLRKTVDNEDSPSSEQPKECNRPGSSQTLIDIGPGIGCCGAAAGYTLFRQ